MRTSNDISTEAVMAEVMASRAITRAMAEDRERQR